MLNVWHPSFCLWKYKSSDLVLLVSYIRGKDDGIETTPYHAMEYGMTEIFTRTLLFMLGTFGPNQQLNTKLHVGSLVHVYNCTKHESTYQSPYLFNVWQRTAITHRWSFLTSYRKTTKTANKILTGIKRKVSKGLWISSCLLYKCSGETKGRIWFKSMKCSDWKWRYSFS